MRQQMVLTMTRSIESGSCINVPNDTQRPVQRNQLILELEVGGTLTVRLNVAQVSNMARSIPRCTMMSVEWVEVRTCREAASRHVPESTEALA